MAKKTVKGMDGFVALRCIYVDGETKDHGYVYRGACTTVLATNIPSSEHCPVLSKCIIELCSHETFALFKCMYLHKNSSGTASNSLIKLISGPGLSCDIVQFAWSVALVHGHLYCFVKLNY